MHVVVLHFTVYCSYSTAVCSYMRLYLYSLYYSVGVPAMVPGIKVDYRTINVKGNNLTLTLSWGEPFNNFDPMVNYTVSCSGDVTCPPNFTTTARSHNITNLTPTTNYTFSVVATNSFGSGEAGVLMITTLGKLTDTCIHAYVCTYVRMYVYIRYSSKVILHLLTFF